MNAGLELRGFQSLPLPIQQLAEALGFAWCDVSAADMGEDDVVGVSDIIECCKRWQRDFNGSVLGCRRQPRKDDTERRRIARLGSADESARKILGLA